MRLQWKQLGLVVAGAVAGIAFVLACNDTMQAGDSARADEAAACARWEVKILPVFELEFDTLESGSDPLAMPPEGWEPFSIIEDVGGGPTNEHLNVMLRRCAE